MDDSRDLVEEELQAILAGTPWPGEDPGAPGGGKSVRRPTVRAVVRARYGDRIQKTMFDRHTGTLAVYLNGGKVVSFDREGQVTYVSFVGTRGVLARVGNVFTWWLPDAVVPWRRPD